MEKWYTKTIEETRIFYETDIDLGLSSEETKFRLKAHGKNEFDEEKKETLFQNIVHQLKDVSTIVLLFAGVLSLALAIREGHGYIEPIVIFGVVIMNITLAITQERKVEQALEALASLNSPTCQVIRDGEVTEIETSEVVPGDIISISTGSYIPADARIISSSSLQVDESALTGESEPVDKVDKEVFKEDIPIGDRVNMVFSGTLVTAGTGKAIVTYTGMDTQMGIIAGYLNNSQKIKTPLQDRLDKIGKMISLVAVVSALVLLFVGLKQGNSFWNVVLLATSLAVAAVPETLNLIVTLSLTNGVNKMVKSNALIRKLPAVETLGNVNVICSDKTGTLTKNKMKVQRIYLSNDKCTYTDELLDDEFINFIQHMELASDASYTEDENGDTVILGNPTEQGIVKLLLFNDQEPLDKKRIAQIPFSSSRKMMSVVIEEEDGYLVLTKGALDRLPLKKGITSNIKKAHDDFASEALRVLALGYKKIDKLPDDIESIEEDLEFWGLIGLIDPPRPKAAKAIKEAKNAGVRTIMITGDHAATASAIAKQLGILNNDQVVITGERLDKMSDEELIDNIRDYNVFARVSPQNKIRIVEALQEKGAVVAMTGDGVNDAPALKAADVGIAMGISGTEVAKSAADMILTDDNFSTIVEAIKEGRNVYSNIKKVIYFLLVCNLSEIAGVLFAQIAGWGVLVTPSLLLLVNVLGDGIPGLNLAKEISDPRIMKREPIRREESFFSGGLLRVITIQTIASTFVMLAAFYIGKFVQIGSVYNNSETLGQTMAFLVLGWSSIIHIFTVRSRKSIFRKELNDNLPLVYSAFLMIIIFGLMVLIKPIGSIFGLVPMSLLHWLIVIVLSIIPITIAEIIKHKDYRCEKDEYCKRVVNHQINEDSLY